MNTEPSAEPLDDAEALTARRKRKRRRRLLISLGVILVFFAILIVYDLTGKRAYQRAYDEAVALGGPVTLEELLAARKPLPDDQNGAQVIRGIGPRIGDMSEEPLVEAAPFVGDIEDPPLGRRWSDETMRAAQACLDAYTDELDAIRSLENYGGIQFELTLPDNPADIIDQQFSRGLTRLRACAKLVKLETMTLAMRGDASHLVDGVRLQSMLVGAAENQPFLIGTLVAVALQAVSVDTIECVLSVNEASPSQLADLDLLLASFDRPGDLIETAFRGERAFFIALQSYARKHGGESQVPPALMKLPGVPGYFWRDAALGLECFNVYMQATRADTPSTAAIEANQQVQDELKSRYFAGILTRFLFPSLQRSVTLILRSAGEVRCARAGIAAERFRLDAGRMPGSLDELVPKYLDAVPVDPFADGGPIKLKRLDDRLVFYSIGDDGIDQGGKLESAAPDDEAIDFGFTLLMPEARNRPPTTRTAPAG